MTTEVESPGPALMQEPVLILKPTDQRSPTSTLPHIHPYDDHSSQSSLASRLSGQLPAKLSQSEASPTTVSAPIPEDLTPPSSTASSVHQHEPNGDLAKADRGNLEPAAISSYQPVRQSRSPSTSGSLSEGTNGVKRTASGQVKISQHAETSTTNSDPRHVRASSSLSSATNSNVTEIGQQLRTRLKYAMVKVQNGWQTRSLDELESIASASPRSHASPFQGLGRGSPSSPRGPPISKMTRKWSDSSSSESSLTGPRSTLPSVTSNTLKPNGHRSLAPPADIVPSSRRRPTPNEAAWHGLSTSQPHSQSLSSQSRPSSQRTPSQNAAMEADAVETLLFMASPSNSGYHASTSQASQESNLRSTLTNWSAQTSPLRTQFSQTSVTSPKRVAFEDQTLHGKSKSEAIDRMIDSVLESDESEREIEEALRLVDERKVTA